MPTTKHATGFFATGGDDAAGAVGGLAGCGGCGSGDPLVAVAVTAAVAVADAVAIAEAAIVVVVVDMWLCRPVENFCFEMDEI